MKDRNLGKLKITLTLLLYFTTQVAVVHAANSDQLVHRAADLPDEIEDQVIVDTRPLSSCQKSSLASAICLPVEDVLAPNRRLANWSGILWLLGTANLAGDEHVLVIGERSDRRDFIAGLLLLAGQHRITVIDTSVSELISDNNQPIGGSTRATTRTKVYTAVMRSELIVLQNELEQLMHSGTVILDGRSEAEYYGAKIRGARGGHIPGASNSPLSQWRNAAVESTALYKPLSPVSYAHDTFDSVVYLTALRTAGVTARAYLPGWVEWAANGTLPADSAAFPVNSKGQATTAVAAKSASVVQLDRTGFVAIAMAMLCMLVVSFYMGYKSSTRTI